jgi:hypothetical protein
MEMREFYDEVIAGRRVTVVRASEVFKKLVSTHWVCVLWATGGVLRQGGAFGGWCRDVVVRFTLLFLRCTLRLVQDYPFTQLSQWVFQAVKPESKSDITFSEYVHMVSFFVMLGSKELMKFLFQAVDTDNRQYLT